MKNVLVIVFIIIQCNNVCSQGFNSTPINWSTPVGGQYSSSSYNYGYNLIAGSSNNNNNSQNWSIVDIDGDSKLDLVVSSAYVGAGGYSLQYGATTNPYWKVYLNNGSGFNSTPINWSTPVGGQYSSSSYNYGYNLIAGSSNNNNNSQNWSIVDIDGDSKLDLVVSSAYVGAGGYSLQYGATTNPYWKVYLNSSSLSLQKSERNIVLIYPNPTNESFKIKLQNELITAQVEVFNSIGTKVYSELSYKSQQDIICNQLTKGLYLVKIINGKGVTFQKILIQ